MGTIAQANYQTRIRTSITIVSWKIIDQVCKRHLVKVDTVLTHCATSSYSHNYAADDNISLVILNFL